MFVWCSIFQPNYLTGNLVKIKYPNYFKCVIMSSTWNGKEKIKLIRKEKERRKTHVDLCYWICIMRNETVDFSPFDVFFYKSMKQSESCIEQLDWAMW